MEQILYVTTDDILERGLADQDALAELPDGMLVGVYELKGIRVVRQVHETKLEDPAEDQTEQAA